MLDIVGIALRRTGHGYRRLDGSMSIMARDAAINEFAGRSDVSHMSLSICKPTWPIC
jgi:SNF2 family DNA or RNA helicase